MLTVSAAFFFSATPIGGAFSGLIAYAVDKNLDGHRGRPSWQWYFIIDGLITIAWGLVVMAFLPKLPETVAKRGSWLFRNEEELAVLMRRTVESEYPPPNTQCRTTLLTNVQPIMLHTQNRRLARLVWLLWTLKPGSVRPRSRRSP